MNNSKHHLKYRYRELLGRRRPVFIALLLLSLPFGLALYLLSPKIYTASCQLSYEPHKYQSGTLSMRESYRVHELVSILTKIITSGQQSGVSHVSFTLSAKEGLRLVFDDDKVRMRSRISVDTHNNSDIIHISSAGEVPWEVARTANDLALRVICEGMRSHQNGGELELARAIFVAGDDYGFFNANSIELSGSEEKTEKDLLKSKIEKYDYEGSVSYRGCEEDESSLSKGNPQSGKPQDKLSARHLGKLQWSGPFKVENYAQIPEKPSKPDFFLIMGISVLTTIGVGIGGVLIFDFFDTSFRDPDLIESSLGVELLTAVPYVKSGQEENQLRKKRFRNWSVCLLAVGVVVALFLFVWLHGALIL